MTRLRDRLIRGWSDVPSVSAVLGALLMFVEWQRQWRRLAEQVRLDESGWERPDV